MNIFTKFLKSSGSNESSDTSSLNKWFTFGDHLYRRSGEDPSIIFTSASGKKHTIVDYNGNICGFPGIDSKTEGIVIGHLKEGSLEPKVRYRTDFERCKNGQIIMIWQVQPDGMYWQDEDGYGMTPDEEILLYSFIDENGRFTEPFKLYKIGIENFTDF